MRASVDMNRRCDMHSCVYTITDRILSTTAARPDCIAFLINTPNQLATQRNDLIGLMFPKILLTVHQISDIN